MFRRTLAVTYLLVVLLVTGCGISLIKANPSPEPTFGIKAATPTGLAPRPTLSPQPQPAIVVNAPIAGQQVRSPVRISGTAQVFEGTVLFAVKDATGKIIGKGFATATAGAPGRGTFSADISFTQPIASQSGTVEVYSESPKDGTVQNLVAIKVTLAGQ